MFSFFKKEKELIKFWKKNKIFEKSLKKGKPFVFYEGPPTVNARPGIHHVLSRVFKDIICRYRTMRGFKVLRKTGWDTHGLPVELEIEKKLGLKSKKDIEKYGITKFNKKCKQSAWEYKKDWEKLTERIGFWLDMENPYITYQPDYIETVWWILKQVWQKGLLYQDFKAVPNCPRCQTSLSNHEVALGYQRIKEPTIYVKFQIPNSTFQTNSKFETKRKAYLLVWTTTPWTLSGNVAVALNPKFSYVKVKVNGEYLILAKERLKACGIEGEVIEEFKGKDLLGLKYQPPFPANYFLSREHKIYEVIGGDFISLEEGTGLVHIAPAFGEEDMELIKMQNEKCKMKNEPEFPILVTIDEEGKFKSEVKKWAGLFFKEADPLIIEDLKERNLLFKEELYEHDYPFCWRCSSPLLYYAKKSWFISMTKVKKDLIKNNQEINWIPSHLKKGRFGQWLEEIKDWALSRERFWATPLPIWKCQNNHIVVIGSKVDLLSQKFSSNQYFILRHGQTIYQKKKKEEIYPEKEKIGLTKKGIKQARKAAEKLKKEGIDLIYSSDFYRTKKTVQIVASKLNLKINFDSKLRDLNLGVYHGKSKKEFYNEFPISKERFEKRPPKGESWLDCQKRMIKFLKRIDKKHQNKKILIVSHGDPLWLLEGAVKGKSKEELIEERKKKGVIKTGEIRKLEFKKLPFNEKMELDFHRPYIDEVKFFCPKCQGVMERVPEVIDCWFDSGAMPFAQAHFPFAWPQIQNSKFKIQNFTKKGFLFPADFICEGIDQTRGWFYTLLAISTLLGFGSPFRNVISLGHVLDAKGEKMSKSKGNVVDPWKILEKYGADALRWYFFTINQPGEPKLFSEKEVENCLKKFILKFWHCFQFFQIYKESKKLKIKLKPKIENSLDRWIFSKLNKLIKNVTESLDQYEVTLAARKIEEFVLNDLSLWYLRRSRKRFQNPENDKELKKAFNNLGTLVFLLSKILAPFVPFLAERIYQSFKDKNPKRESVHLEKWPKIKLKLIDQNLEEKMERAREIVSLVLAKRKKAKIKVRQPLPQLKIKDLSLREEKDILDLIKEEVNVKKITFDDKIKNEIELETKITPELKEEGLARELIRNIQQKRKEKKYKPHDKILIFVRSDQFLENVFNKKKEFILEKTGANDLIFKEFKEKKEIEIESHKVYLKIKKI